jgi:demethylspheroidene O-methyltransferase
VPSLARLRLWAYRWRDRLIASERFQRFAVALPFLRPVVHRHERALFDLCAGFIYSQVLFACVRLGVIAYLRDGAQTEAAIAQRTGLPPDGARRLIRAAEALGLLADRGGGRYGLGLLGAALAGNAGVAAMIEHHAALYADLEDPVALLNSGGGTGKLAAYWRYATADHAAGLQPEEVAPYSELMGATQQAVADEILRAYPLARHRCLLDAGGGDGRFIEAAARRYPHLRFKLADLPAVAARARERLSPLSDRVDIRGGDFRVDALPTGADVVTLIRILLDHDDDTALRILSGVRAALPENGVVLVAEPMSGVPGAEPVAPYFGMYLKAMGRGKPRTPNEVAALLAQAGFHRIRQIRTLRPLLVSLIAGHAAENMGPTVSKS